MNDVQVIAGDGINDDATIVIPGVTKRDNAWLTINLAADRPKYSINIIDNGEGLEVHVYFAGAEDGPSEASCTVPDTDVWNAL